MVSFICFCLAFLAIVAAQTDPCSVHPTCTTCVNDVGNACGWCSTKVVYQNGFVGGQCASNSGSNPFSCYGVYSTEDCAPGWQCNNSTHTCHPTTPGTGTNKYACYEQCGEIPPSAPAPAGGPTYVCNSVNFTCELPPPGLHGHAKEICEALCQPTPPATPATPTTPAKVYTCNKSNYTCSAAKPGTPGATSFGVCKGSCAPQKNYTCNFKTYQCQETNGTSGVALGDCEQSCVKLYHCNTEGLNYQCVVSPFPSPGVPLATCESHCHPSNSTPAQLSGLWRGLQVNKNYTKGEIDLEFRKGMMYLVGPNGMQISGNTTFLGTASRRLVRVTIKKSTVLAYPVDSFLELWYTYDGTSPETRFLMMAAGASNEYAPSVWSEAMSSTDGFALSLAACQPLTNCTFHLRSADKMETQSMFETSTALSAGHIKDPCAKHASCDLCLSQPRCGWCSVPVRYRSGQRGGQCAGLAESTSGDRIQFKCNGIYRTDNCNDYECVLPQAQCVKVALGAGTNHSECKLHCKRPGSVPVPFTPPPPAAPAYPTIWYCNETLNECMPASPGQPGATSRFICENICGAPPAAPATPSQPVPPITPVPIAPVYICSSARKCQRADPGQPGATSKLICESTCVAPPPPPSHLNGVYRGLQIDNQYKVGEFAFTFEENSFSLTLNGGPYASGTVGISSEHGALLLNFEEPIQINVAAIYSLNVGLEVSQLTLVISNNADAPTGWDLPWIQGGKAGREFLFIKDNNSEY